MSEDVRLRPAVFLDRDGTLADEVGYVNHVSRFRLFGFSPAAVRRLNEVNVPAIVVTNQSGVARGYFPTLVLDEVHAEMKRQLAAAGAHLDGIYICPHTAQDDCDCRKPKPGLLERAAREHHLDLRRSFVVGDRYRDVESAHRAGARGVLVLTGYGRGEHAWNRAQWPRQPEHIAENLTAAVDWVLEELR